MLARDVWLVGDDFVVEHWDGARLSRVALPMGGEGAFHDVSGTGPDDVWAVGTGAAIVHYDGRDWTVVAIPTRSTLRAVHVGLRLWVGGDHVIASAALGGNARSTPKIE